MEFGEVNHNDNAQNTVRGISRLQKKKHHCVNLGFNDSFLVVSHEDRSEEIDNLAKRYSAAIEYYESRAPVLKGSAEAMEAIARLQAGFVE